MKATHRQRPQVRPWWRSLQDGVRLARPYFASAERVSAWALLLGVVVLQLAVVGIDVAINHWRGAFFEALQKKDGPAFTTQLWVYCVIGGGYVLVTTFQAYVTQWLSVRWRRKMSEALVARWLEGHAHFKMQMREDGPDNPDQRIAEDVRAFVRLSLALTVGLLGNVVSLASFVFILWALSAAAPLTLLGFSRDLPGYLVWAALAYATAGTVMAHFIGRALVPLDVQQERREADYRYALVRLRENGEAIALAHGERHEQASLAKRFDALVHNTYARMRRQRNLSFFTAGYKHASLVFPYLVVGPLYFAGHMTLGVLMQTGSAFAQVRTALSYLITSYGSLAEAAAVVQRLTEFEAGIAKAKGTAEAITSTRTGHGGLVVTGLRVTSPDAATLLAALAQMAVGEGEQLLLFGPPGAGKTSLMKAVMGAWPRASGAVRSSFQRPWAVQSETYLPLGSLREALAYPSAGAHLSATAAALALRRVGLAGLADEVTAAEMAVDPATGMAATMAPWSGALSAGERQRFGVARALLARPDVLWLDEAFNALPPDEAERLFNLMRADLPMAALILLAHEAPAWFVPTRVVRLMPASANPPLTVC